jgi:hypothetical protein
VIEQADQYIGHEQVSFRLVIDEAHLIREISASLAEPGAARDPYEQVSEKYVSRLVSELRPVAGSLTVSPEPYGGGKAGGPIPDQNYAIELIGVVSDVAGRIVDLVALGVIVRSCIGKLRSITQNEVAVSDGCAIVLAAEAVSLRTGRRDLTLAFIAPLHDYLIDAGGGHGSDASFVVGFRDRGQVFVAEVSRTGRVSLTDAPIALSRADQGDGNPSHDQLWADIFDRLPAHWTPSPLYEDPQGGWDVSAYDPNRYGPAPAGQGGSFAGHGSTPEDALRDLGRKLGEKDR